jgi:hypothetical protein
MKFFHVTRWGCLLSWGLNYKQGGLDTAYILVFPYWFPFYGKYTPDNQFGEFLSLVIPVMRIDLKNHDGRLSFHFYHYRRELKRMWRLISIPDLIHFLSFHLSSLPDSRSLKMATEMIGDLRKRGLTPEKIESLLQR